LTLKAKEFILNPKNDIFISVASIWEISIKYQLGRGDMPVSGSRATELFYVAGYELLPIQATHAIVVESLPSIHNDPFDRLIIGQALTEPMRLITHDRTITRYSDTIIFV
jgi:PIN domain nuclease of toxin-antitoxin system